MAPASRIALRIAPMVLLLCAATVSAVIIDYEAENGEPGGVQEDCRAVVLQSPLHFRMLNHTMGSNFLRDGFNMSTNTDIAVGRKPADVSELVDPECNCLRDVFISVDMRTPRLSYKIEGNITFYASDGTRLFGFRANQGQQNQFTEFAEYQLNRLTGWIQQGPRLGENITYDDVAYYRLEHNGHPELGDVDPQRYDEMYWETHGIYMRKGCKECSAMVNPFFREPTNIDFSLPREVTEVCDRSEMLPADAWLDMSHVVNPDCNCLFIDGYSEHPTGPQDPWAKPAKMPALQFTMGNTQEYSIQRVELVAMSGKVLADWQNIELAIGLPGKRDMTLWLNPENDLGSNAVADWQAVKVRVTRNGSDFTLPDRLCINVTDVTYLSHAPTTLGDMVINTTTIGANFRDESTFSPLILSLTTERVHYVGAYEASAMACNAMSPLWRTDGPVSETVYNFSVPSTDGSPAAIAVAQAQKTELLNSVMFLREFNLSRGVTVSECLWDTRKDSDCELRITMTADNAPLMDTPDYNVCNLTTAIFLNEHMETVFKVELPWYELTPNASIKLAGPMIASEVAYTPIGEIVAVQFTAEDCTCDIGVTVDSIAVHNTTNLQAEQADLQPECFPETWNWLDETIGQFQYSVPGRNAYWHCRTCCCYFDDPSVQPYARRCYEQGDVIGEVSSTGDINEQCQVCNRFRNPDVITAKPYMFDNETVPCDDEELCTWGDECTIQGTCEAHIYTSCLNAEFNDDDPSKDCEVCDGSGPFSPTAGCAAKPGMFVHNAGTANRTCGCGIGGEIYPHDELREGYPCQLCDVRHNLGNTTGWTNKPDDVKCDPKTSWWWKGSIDDWCQYEPICDEGDCRGTPYTCPEPRVCSIITDEFPYICDMNGPADANTAGCVMGLHESNYTCRPYIHGCKADVACTGVLHECGPYIELAGTIYENNNKTITPLRLDGTPVDWEYGVVASGRYLAAAFNDFRVQCDELTVRWAVILGEGACSVDRVSTTIGDGFGLRDLPYDRGFAILANDAELELTWIPDSRNMTIVGSNSIYIPSVTQDLSRFLDPHCECMKMGAIAFDIKITLAYFRMRSLFLHDIHGNVLEFVLPFYEQLLNTWARVNVGVDVEKDSVKAFDWANIDKLQFVRRGPTNPQKAEEETLRAYVRNLVFRRDLPPFCTAQSIVGEEALTMPYNSSESTWMTAEIEGNDITEYTKFTDRDDFIPNAVLTFEIRTNDPTPALVEVYYSGDIADQPNSGFHVPLPPALVLVPDVWEVVRVPLTQGHMRNLAVTSWSKLDSLKLTFDVALDALEFAPDVRVRNMRVMLNNQDCSSKVIPSPFVDLFTAPTSASAIHYTSSDSTLDLAIDGDALVLRPGVDLPLSYFYDAECNCLKNAFLTVIASFSKSTTLLSAVQIVDGTDAGIEVPLNMNSGDATLRFGKRKKNVITVPITEAMQINDPDSTTWDDIFDIRFKRTGVAPGELDFKLGDVWIHSVAVHPSQYECADELDAWIRRVHRPETFRVIPFTVVLQPITGTSAAVDERTTSQLVADRVTLNYGATIIYPDLDDGKVEYTSVSPALDYDVTTTGRVVAGEVRFSTGVIVSNETTFVTLNEGVNGRQKWMTTIPGFTRDGVLYHSNGNHTHMKHAVATKKTVIAVGYGATTPYASMLRPNGTRYTSELLGQTVATQGGVEGMIVQLHRQTGERINVVAYSTPGDDYINSVSVCQRCANRFNSGPIFGDEDDDDDEQSEYSPDSLYAFVGTTRTSLHEFSFFCVGYMADDDVGSIQAPTYCHHSADVTWTNGWPSYNDGGNAHQRESYDSVYIADDDSAFVVGHRSGVAGAGVNDTFVRRINPKTGSISWTKYISTHTNHRLQFPVAAFGAMATDIAMCATLEGNFEYDSTTYVQSVNSRPYTVVAKIDFRYGHIHWAHGYADVEGNLGVTCAGIGADPITDTAYTAVTGGRLNKLLPQEGSSITFSAIDLRMPLDANAGVIEWASDGTARLADYAYSTEPSYATGISVMEDFNVVSMTTSGAAKLSFGKPPRAVMRHPAAEAFDGIENAVLAVFARRIHGVPLPPPDENLFVDIDVSLGRAVEFTIVTRTSVAALEIAVDPNLTPLRIYTSRSIIDGSLEFTFPIPDEISVTTFKSDGGTKLWIGGYASSPTFDYFGTQVTVGHPEKLNETVAFENTQVPVLGLVDSGTGKAVWVEDTGMLVGNSRWKLPSVDQLTALSANSEQILAATYVGNFSREPIQIPSFLPNYTHVKVPTWEHGEIDSEVGILFQIDRETMLVRVGLMFGGRGNSTVRITDITLADSGRVATVVGEFTGRASIPTNVEGDQVELICSKQLCEADDNNKRAFIAGYAVTNMRLIWVHVVDSYDGPSTSKINSVLTSSAGMFVCGSVSGSGSFGFGGALGNSLSSGRSYGFVAKIEFATGKADWLSLHSDVESCTALVEVDLNIISLGTDYYTSDGVKNGIIQIWNAAYGSKRGTLSDLKPPSTLDGGSLVTADAVAWNAMKKVLVVVGSVRDSNGITLAAVGWEVIPVVAETLLSGDKLPIWFVTGIDSTEGFAFGKAASIGTSTLTFGGHFSGSVFFNYTITAPGTGESGFVQLFNREGDVMGIHELRSDATDGEAKITAACSTPNGKSHFVGGHIERSGSGALQTAFGELPSKVANIENVMIWIDDRNASAEGVSTYGSQAGINHIKHCAASNTDVVWVGSISNDAMSNTQCVMTTTSTELLGTGQFVWGNTNSGSHCVVNSVQIAPNAKMALVSGTSSGSTYTIHSGEVYESTMSGWPFVMSINVFTLKSDWQTQWKNWYYNAAIRSAKWNEDKSRVVIARDQTGYFGDWTLRGEPKYRQSMSYWQPTNWNNQHGRAVLTFHNSSFYPLYQIYADVDQNTVSYIQDIVINDDLVYTQWLIYGPSRWGDIAVADWATPSKPQPVLTVHDVKTYSLVFVETLGTPGLSIVKPHKLTYFNGKLLGVGSCVYATSTTDQKMLQLPPGFRPRAREIPRETPLLFAWGAGGSDGATMNPEAAAALEPVTTRLAQETWDGACASLAVTVNTAWCLRSVRNRTFLSSQREVDPMSGERGVLLALHSQSLSVTSAYELMGSHSNDTTVLNDVTASVTEEFACVVGSIAPHYIHDVDVFGVKIEARRTHTHEIIVSCFDDVKATVAWSKMWGASSTHDMGYAITSIVGMVVAFGGTQGQGFFGGELLTNDGASFGVGKPTRCVMLVYTEDTGEEVFGRLFGSDAQYAECTVRSAAADVLENTIAIAGGFSGTNTMVFDGGVLEVASDSTDGLGFIAVLDLNTARFKFGHVTQLGGENAVPGTPRPGIFTSTSTMTVASTGKGVTFGVAEFNSQGCLLSGGVYAVRTSNDFSTTACCVVAYDTASGENLWSRVISAESVGEEATGAFCPSLTAHATGMYMAINAIKVTALSFTSGRFGDKLGTALPRDWSVILDLDAETGSINAMYPIGLVQAVKLSALQESKQKFVLSMMTSRGHDIALFGDNPQILATQSPVNKIQVPYVLGLAHAANPGQGIKPLDPNVRPVVDDFDGYLRDYTLVFDLQTHNPDVKLTHAEWRETFGKGVGITFDVPSDIQEVPDRWATVRIDLTDELNVVINEEITMDMWEELASITFFHDGPETLPPELASAGWDIRNMYLEKGDITCADCGTLQLVGSVESVLTVDDELAYLAGDALNGQRDVSHLMHKPDGSLTGVTLEMKYRWTDSDCLPAKIWMGNSPDAYVEMDWNTINSHSSSLGSGWYQLNIPLDADVVYYSDMFLSDWTVMGMFRWYPLNKQNCNEDVRIKDMWMRRQCKTIDSFVVEESQLQNNVMIHNRTDFSPETDLDEGIPWRVLAVGKNVYGDLSVPLCSDRFWVDYSPPEVNLTAHDMSPAFGADRVQVWAHNGDVMKAYWNGSGVVEPQSSPDNLIDFTIEYYMEDGVVHMIDPPINMTRQTLTSFGFVETGVDHPVLQDGSFYQYSLSVVNRAGHITRTEYSEGFISDRSAPQVTNLREYFISGEVDETYSPGADETIVAQANYTALRFAWDDVCDPHTPITDVWVGIGSSVDGTKPAAPNAAAFRHVQPEHHVIHHQWDAAWENDRANADPCPDIYSTKPSSEVTLGVGSEFIHGVTYHTIVRTQNAAGAFEDFVSEGVIIDRTDPTLVYVVDVMPWEIEDDFFLLDNNLGDVSVVGMPPQARAKFKCDDPESGIAEYQWRMCKDPECVVTVTDWKSTGNVTRDTVEITEGSVDFDEELYTVFKCQNGVGTWKTFVSDGFNVTFNPPNMTLAWVKETPADDTLFEDYSTTYQDELRLVWGGVTNSPGFPFLGYYLEVFYYDTDGTTRISVLNDTVTDDNDVLYMGLDGVEHITNSGFKGENRTIHARLEAKGAGGSGYLTSNGILIDTIGPVVRVKNIICETCDMGDFGNKARVWSKYGEKMAWALEVIDDGSGVRTCDFGISTCADPTDFNVLPPETIPGFDEDIVARPHHSRQVVAESGLTLALAVEYCATFTCTSKSGVKSENLTVPLIIDTLAPEIHRLHFGNHPVLSNPSLKTGEDITAYISCTDIGSGLDFVEARVIQTNTQGGGQVVGNWSEFLPTEELLTLSEANQGFSFTPELHFNYTVEAVCYDKAGGTARSWSPGARFDNSPPVNTSAAVYLTSDTYVHAAYSHSSTTVTASWYGWTDAESEIVDFAWAIGTSPYAYDAMSVTDVGPSTTGTATGLSLQDGVEYYITVWGFNAAGLSSTAVSPVFTVDSTPPVVALVKVNATFVQAQPADAGYVPDTEDLTVSWESVDPHSSSVGYQVAIGTAPYSDSIRAFLDVGTAWRHDFTGLGLTPGTDYWATLIAVNDAGLRTVALSSPFTVDITPPEKDAAVTNSATGRVTYHSIELESTIPCSWGFRDGESGLHTVEVGISGHADHRDDAANFTSVTVTDTYADVDASALVSGKWYHCVVRATNGAGLQTLAWSSSFKVDNEAPEAGTVNDGFTPAMDVDLVNLQSLKGMIAVQWEDWRDTGSHIARMEWAIGTSSGDTSIQDWTYVRFVNGHAETPVDGLAAGTTYFSGLRAYDPYGRVTTKWSDGFTPMGATSLQVQLSGTTATLVNIAAEPSMDASTCSCPDDNASFDNADVACKCNPGYYLAADGTCTTCPTALPCKAMYGNSLAQCTATPQSGSCDADESAPASGVTDISGLNACDANDDAKVLFSSNCVCPPGQRLDDMDMCEMCPTGRFKPTAGNAVGAAACRLCSMPSSASSQLAVSWDAPAGVTIDSYTVHIGHSMGAERWSYPGFDGAATEALVGEAAAFTQGSVLWVTVHGIQNGVNSTSVVAIGSSAAIAVDYVPPVPGFVADGPTIATIPYQKETDSVTATWEGFEALASDITKFTIAWGTNASNTAVSGGWTELAANVRTHTESVSLNNLDRVVARVRAYTSSGAFTEVASPGVIVFSEVPDGTIVVRGDAGNSADQGSDTPFPYDHHGAQTSRSRVVVAWALGNGNLGPLDLNYHLTVEDSNGNLVVNASDVSSATFYIAEGLSLADGDMVRASVFAESKSGVSRTLTSDWTTVDNSAPTNGSVWFTAMPMPATAPYVDGANRTILYQKSTANITVDWAFLDDFTAVDRYIVAVGSMVGGDQAVRVMEVADGDTTSVTVDDLELHLGQCYVAQVSAVNEAGLAAEVAVSEPLCIDFTAPTVEAVAVSRGSLDHCPALTNGCSMAGVQYVTYVDDATPISFTATIEDLESGLAATTYDIMKLGSSATSVAAGDVDMSQASSTGEVSVTSSLTHADLVPGDRYAISVFGSNRVDQLTVAASGEFMLVQDAPTGGITDITDQLVADTNIDITVTWEFDDSVTEIASYEYSVTLQSAPATNLTVVEELVPTTVARSNYARITAAWLLPGSVYELEVTACNYAGLCTSDTTTFTVYQSSLTPGFAYLGLAGSDYYEGVVCNQTNEDLETVCAPAAVDQLPRLMPEELPSATVSWLGLNDVDTLEISVGTTPRGQQLVEKMEIDPASTNFTGLLTPSSEVYPVQGDVIFVTIGARNPVGDFVFTSTAVVVMDSAGPQTTTEIVISGEVAGKQGRFNPGNAPAGPDAALVVTMQGVSAVEARWGEFRDNDGITGYTVQLVDAQTLQSVVAPVHVDSETLSHSFDNVALNHSQELRVVVTGSDPSGFSTSLVSEYRLRVDGSAPVALGGVMDGFDLSLDEDCWPRLDVAVDDDTVLLVHKDLDPTLYTATTVNTAMSTLIAAYWLPFSDEQSGVATVEVAVGTTKGGDDILPFTNVPGKVTRVQIALPIQPEGQVLFVTTRGTNGVGMTTDITADGVRMLCSDASNPSCQYDGYFLCTNQQ